MIVDVKGLGKVYSTHWWEAKPVVHCSVAKPCPILCDLMDCSMLGFPILQYLLEFAQTHVCWVSGAFQPSHPLSSPSLPALNHSQHQGLFQWVGSSHQVAGIGTSASASAFFFFSAVGRLNWVFLAAHRLSLVAANEGYSFSWCMSFSWWCLLLLHSTGSRHECFSSCSTRTQ